MGFVCFKNLCMILIFILLTTYYISAFRLIHTHAELPEKETKKDVKEHVRKAYVIKDHEHKNQSIHVKLDISTDTESTPEKKVKIMQPTLTSEIMKEKIKEQLKTKSEPDEDEIIPKMKIIRKDDEGKSKFVPMEDDKLKEETINIVKDLPTKKELPKIKDEDIIKPKLKIIQKDEEGKAKFVPMKDESTKIIKESPKRELPKVKEEGSIKLKQKIIQKDDKVKFISMKDEATKIVKDLPTKKEKNLPNVKDETIIKPKLKIIQKDDEGKAKFVPMKDDSTKSAKDVPSKKEKELPKIKEDDTIKPKIKIIQKDDEGKAKFVPMKDDSTKSAKVVPSKKEKELPKIKEDDTIKPKIKIIQKDVEGKAKPTKIIEKEAAKIPAPKIKEDVKIIDKSTKVQEKPKPKTEKVIKQPENQNPKNEQPKPEKEAPKTQKEESKLKIEPTNPKNQPTENIKLDNDPTLNLLYYNFPSFSPNFDILENEECKKQGKLLLEQLHQHKIWALKMLDSTAKIPSGILKGNLNQFGDYDQCIGIFTKIMNEDNISDVKISGKYCLANIDIEADVKDMKLPVHLAQSRAMIRSKLQDPGHFIPRFTTIRWGICIPSGCTAQDAEKILEDSIKIYNESNTIGLTFDVSVETDQCYIQKGMKNNWDYPINTIITIIITAFIILTVLIATIRDLRFTSEDSVNVDTQEESTLDQIFMSFSLKRTTKSLFKKQSDSDEIECIHGVRSVCSILLYIAHRLIPIGHVPFFNKITLTEIANNPASIILRLSVIYTDSFLLLSGILTSYGMSKDIEEKGYIPWFNRLIARFIRLTPPLMFIILYYAYIIEYLGDGPLWNTVVTPNSNLCKEYWWRNFFYIQNFYPFQDMCATHSHQLALDMQLSLIAPILVWFLYRRPLFGITVTIFLHTLSVILRYYTTMNYRLSLVIYHGISISQLYRTGNFLYASSLHRATPYLAGVGLGVLLRQIKPNFYMPKILTIMGWLVAGYFAGWALYSPSHLSGRMYQYDVNEAAQFSALCSLAWALALSWLIFSCFADNEGYLNKLLSSRPMILLSRISYTLYLSQFIVFFYNVGTIRNPSEFRINTSLSIIEMLIVLLISILLSLIIDLPAQKIKSILLRSMTSQSKDEPEVTKNNIQKPSLDDKISNNVHEMNGDEDRKMHSVHFSEEIEEHEDDDEDTSKRLISQLSTESQNSLEEDDIEEMSDRRLIGQLSTESQMSMEEDFEDDKSGRLVAQLSTESSQTSMEEEHDDYSQMSMEEEHEDISQMSMEEEHFDDQESSDKTLSRELSTERQLSIDEGHFEEEHPILTEEPRKSIEKLWFEDDTEEENNPEEEVVQKITIRLSSNGKISIQDQIQQILDEETHD